MAHITDWKKSPKDIMTDLIRHDNASVLYSSWYDVESTTPLPANHSSGRNTRLLATATDFAPFRGQQEFFYDRRDIDDFIIPEITLLRYRYEGQPTTLQMLAAVNDELRINVIPDMITPENIPIPSPGNDTKAVLRFKSTNWTILGQVELTFYVD